EISRAIAHAIEAGFGAVFVTRTIPHTAEDELRTTLGGLTEGRTWAARHWAVKKVREEAGYLGCITAKEITRGKNGWHPHTHDVEVFRESVTPTTYGKMRKEYFDKLNAFYVRKGHKPMVKGIGVKLDIITRDSDALGRYLVKLQETGVGLGNEMARGDLKKGQKGSLMPFDIAAYFLRTGDTDALKLWREYERETKGKSVIRFSKGLRGLLLPGEEEASDEDLAADGDDAGVEVGRLANWLYRRVVALGLEAAVLRSLDTGGFAALTELLTAYHLDTTGLHGPAREIASAGVDNNVD
ncbi:protein rep, partial [Candidatus Frankia alpina]|uniref:protein rep n=1 Tax=Candidatus Frankia alpina TaxID=2699483 RepID=UPI001F3FCF4B